MDAPNASFDTELVARTASLFAEKRSTFPPGAVEALAKDIVHRLARMAPRSPAIDPQPVSEDSIAAFCDALVQPQPHPALRFIENRRAEGVTRETVYLGYIPGAARCLGERWDADLVSFFQVTYGTGHLYALMRALRAEDPHAGLSPDHRRCALFATVPGEQHGLGVTVAAELFEDAGWDIDLRIGDAHDDLVAHVEHTRPHVIGLSLSTEQRLEALVRLVVALRIAVPRAIIGVAPGGHLDVRRITGLVDIDLVFSDARSARRELDRLVRLRR